MAKVYGLYNDTRRQRYYGKTRRPMRKRIGEHRAGQTASIAHWDFEKDKIRTRLIDKGLSPAQATKKAHKLETRKSPPRWKTIQTGGP